MTATGQECAQSKLFFLGTHSLFFLLFWISRTPTKMRSGSICAWDVSRRVPLNSLAVFAINTECPIADNRHPLNAAGLVAIIVDCIALSSAVVPERHIAF